MSKRNGLRSARPLVPRARTTPSRSQASDPTGGNAPAVEKSFVEKFLETYGPLPDRVIYGDTIDWMSPLALVVLHVELPFWLMVAEATYEIEVGGRTFSVEVSHRFFEAFKEQFTESRNTRMWLGVMRDPEWHKKRPVSVMGEEGRPVAIMERACRTTLTLRALCHTDALRARQQTEIPRADSERDTYRASLCDAYLAVVNEFILRYRLTAYDYFSYEVSAWDVPVWTIRWGDKQVLAYPSGYRKLDLPPLELRTSADGTVEHIWPEFSDKEKIESMSSADAAPGELDLLEARSFMERGNYTDAVRRTISAIETLLEHQARAALIAKYGESEGSDRLRKTDLDVPGRLRQWRKLTSAPITDGEIDGFIKSRQVRHDIVHRARRISMAERGEAQRIVDTGRWLYNKIENQQERARLRDYGAHKSVGRVLVSPRFNATGDHYHFYLVPPQPLYVELPSLDD